LRRALGRRGLVALLVLAFVLHNDLWLWRDGRLVLGLPAGLTYHVGFCVAMSVLMAWIVYGEDAG